MYECDIRFSDSNSTIKDKIQLLANIYELPVEYVWNEYSRLYNIQMSELSKYQYINSWICKQKGLI